MERRSALIVSGSGYCSLLGLDGRSDYKKVVLEIERLCRVKFSNKYFFLETARKQKKSLGSDLLTKSRQDSHHSDGWFGKETVDNNHHIVYVEEGLDVAMGTKIIELAYGLNGEDAHDTITVVTDQSSLLKAIECADGKKHGLVKVISSSPVTAATELSLFSCIDPENNTKVYLDDIVKRCLLDPQRSTQPQTVDSPPESIISSLASTSPAAAAASNDVPLVTDESSASEPSNFPAADGETMSNGCVGVEPSDSNVMAKSTGVVSRARIVKADYLRLHRATQVVDNLYEEEEEVVEKEGQVSLRNVLIRVKDAGVKEVNGEYHFVGWMNRGGMFARFGTFEGKPAKFTLYKCAIKQSHKFEWFMSLTPAAMRPGSSQDVNFYYSPMKTITDRVPEQPWYCMFSRRLGGTGDRPPVLTAHLCRARPDDTRLAVNRLKTKRDSGTSQEVLSNGTTNTHAENGTKKRRVNSLQAPVRGGGGGSGGDGGRSNGQELASADVAGSGRRKSSNRYHALDSDSHSEYSISRDSNDDEDDEDKDEMDQSECEHGDSELSPVVVEAVSEESVAASILADLFPFTPTGRVTEDVRYQLQAIASHYSTALSTAGEVAAATCHTFQEMHCKNRLVASMRGVSLMVVEFAVNGDSDATRCAKTMRRVFPALSVAEVERYLRQTLEKVGALLLSDSTAVTAEHDQCVYAVRLMCEVLARCAELVVPVRNSNSPDTFAEATAATTTPIVKNPTAVAKSSPIQLADSATADRSMGDIGAYLDFTGNASTSDQASTGRATGAAVAGESEEMRNIDMAKRLRAKLMARIATGPVVATITKGRDLLLEKLFVAQFMELFSTVDPANITIHMFTGAIQAVAADWKVSESESKSACREVYRMLSELRKTGTRARDSSSNSSSGSNSNSNSSSGDSGGQKNESQRVTGEESVHSRCLKQLGSVFRNLSEKQLSLSVMRLAASLAVLKLGGGGKDALLVLGKFCALLDRCAALVKS